MVLEDDHGPTIADASGAEPRRRLPARRPEAPLDDVIDTEMSASGGPGVAYAVVGDGGTITAGARRHEDRERRGGHTGHRFPHRLNIRRASPPLPSCSWSRRARSTSTTSSRATSTVSLADRPQRSRSGSCYVSGGTDEWLRRLDRAAQVAPVSPPGIRWKSSNLDCEILGGPVEEVSGRATRTMWQPTPSNRSARTTASPPTARPMSRWRPGTRHGSSRGALFPTTQQIGGTAPSATSPYRASAGPSTPAPGGEGVTGQVTLGRL